MKNCLQIIAARYRHAPGNPSRQRASNFDWQGSVDAPSAHSARILVTNLSDMTTLPFEEHENFAQVKQPSFAAQTSPSVGGHETNSNLTHGTMPQDDGQSPDPLARAALLIFHADTAPLLLGLVKAQTIIAHDARVTLDVIKRAEDDSTETWHLCFAAQYDTNDANFERCWHQGPFVASYKRAKTASETKLKLPSVDTHADTLLWQWLCEDERVALRFDLGENVLIFAKNTTLL